MKRILIAIVGIGLLAAIAAAQTNVEKPKAFYKAYHLNLNTVVVTCKDGSKPKIQDYSSTGAVFVTCN